MPAKHSINHLPPFSTWKKTPGPKDVPKRYSLLCEFCHSDIHTARNEMGGTIFPVVPGSRDRRKSYFRRFRSSPSHKVGDYLGVGCMVDPAKLWESFVIERLRSNSAKKELFQVLTSFPTFKTKKKQYLWRLFNIKSSNWKVLCFLVSDKPSH